MGSLRSAELTQLTVKWQHFGNSKLIAFQIRLEDLEILRFLRYPDLSRTGLVSLRRLECFCAFSIHEEGRGEGLLALYAAAGLGVPDRMPHKAWAFEGRKSMARRLWRTQNMAWYVGVFHKWWYPPKRGFMREIPSINGWFRGSPT